MKRSSQTPNSPAAGLRLNGLTSGSTAKLATVVVSVRMSERLKEFLVSTAQTNDQALSPFIERLLWQSEAVQDLLLGNAPKAVARRWTLDEIGLAHFGQLALATNSLDRLVVALERSLREAKAVDALQVYEIAHAIEQQLGQLQTLNVVRAKAARGIGP